MPTYVQPTYNTDTNIWHAGTPISGPPDIFLKCNLSPGRLVGVDTFPGAQHPPRGGLMWLRLPNGTDIRDDAATNGADTVECPAGSGKFYTSIWVDDIGTDFPNMHRFAALAKLGKWTPPFGSGAPPTQPPITPSASLLSVSINNVSAGPTTSLDFIFGVGQPSQGVVFTVIFDAPLGIIVPAGAVSLMPILAIPNGPHTAYLQAWSQALPLGANLVPVRPVDGMAHLMAAVGGATVGQGTGAYPCTSGTGMGGAPMPMYGGPLTGPPLLGCFVGMLEWAPNVGEAVLGPWVQYESTGGFVGLGGSPYLRLFMTGAVGQPPPPTGFTPFIGWNAYGWAFTEVT
jgi:hypothetical protein